MGFLLYTRRGCHLCEIAEEFLAAQGLNTSVEVVDVDTDPGLQQLYGLRVPVLAVDGVVVLEGRFHEADVACLGSPLASRLGSRSVTSPDSGPIDQGRRQAPPTT